MSARSVLIIAFAFPPYREVGGKRWTKFARILAERGWNVHVITTQWGPAEGSAYAEVDMPGIHVHRAYSPGVHRLRARTFDDSVRGRVARRLNKELIRFLTACGLGEDARAWGVLMLPLARRVAHRHKIDTIVSTGAPFFANWWAARLKQSLPDSHLVVEFQDPFADLPAFQCAGGDKLRRARTLEKEFIAQADVVVTVTEGLSRRISTAHPDADVRTIANGYDKEEFTAPGAPRPRDFSMLYAGNLFVGRQLPLASFLESVRRLHSQMPELVLDFYGRFPADVRRGFVDLEECGVLRINDRVSTQEIVEHMDNAFVCLQFNAEEFSYLVSTKIYEYGFARRPVLSVNYGGEVEDLVNECKLGWSVRGDDPGALDQRLIEIYEQWRTCPELQTAPVALEQYEYQNLSTRYEELLSDLGHGE